jgi:6-phosphogluconolactonase/glucosamine-6-phosphate isomerase/deaminase
MAEKSSVKADKMSSAEAVQNEISQLLRQLACPVAAGDSVKALIRRAAHRTGLPYSKTKRYWYSEVRVVPAHDADNIRTAAQSHEDRLKRTLLENLMAFQTSDPTFYREAIEKLGAQVFSGGDNARKAG